MLQREVLKQPSYIMEISCLPYLWHMLPAQKEHIQLVEVDYKKYQGEFCGDFKVIAMFLVLQAGYTKYSCFMCERDGRARDTHYSRKNGPHKQSLTPGLKNVIYKPMIKPSKVLPPPLHGQAKRARR
jgi:hypothetical protein